MKGYKDLSEIQAVELRVAMGHEIIKFLGLKQDKKTGMVKTAWGNKHVQGIGSEIIGILETELKRITE